MIACNKVAISGKSKSFPQRLMWGMKILRLSNRRMELPSSELGKFAGPGDQESSIGHVKLEMPRRR